MSNFDPELTLRASVDDAMTAPLERIEGQVRDVGEAAAQTGRRAGQEGARGLGVFERAADRLRGSVNRLDERLRTISRRMGTEIGQAARRMSQALVIAGGAAVGFGLKAASNFQATQIAFETLLGSAEKGRAMFRELQSMNLKTPFELRDLASGQQLLLRFNIEGDKALGVLKGLSDVAALTDDPTGNLNAMARAVGQINSAGRLMGQDALQLVQAGINAYDIYARKLGITQAEARKLGEEGKLSADILLDAITNLDSGLEKFRGGAEKMSKTLLGQWSNVKDALNVGLADAASPLVDSLGGLIGTPDKPGPLVQGLTGLVSTVGPPLFSLIGTIANLVSRALPAAEPILTAIAGGLERLLKAAGPSLAGLEPLAGDLGDALVELVDALVPVMPDLVFLFGAFVGILPEFVRLLADLVPLVSPVARLAGGLLSFKPLQGIFAGLLFTLLGYRALSGVVGALYSFAGGIGAINAAQAGGGAAGAAGAATAGRAGLMAGAGRFLPALAGGALIYSAAQDDKPTLGSDLKLIGGTAAIGATVGSIIPGVGTLVGAGAGAAAGGIVAIGRHLLGDVAAPARGRDAAAEASTPGSRTMTSNQRNFAVVQGSGHPAGTSFDRSGSWMMRYRENVRRQGGWAQPHGSHMHADFGDAARPAGARPVDSDYAGGMSGGGAPLVYVAGNVYGMEELEAFVREARRRQDAEAARRDRRPQGKAA